MTDVLVFALSVTALAVNAWQTWRIQQMKRRGEL